VIDVPDRSHVHVRLAAIKFFFRHRISFPLALAYGAQLLGPN
jgi:hypothetical protein